MHGVPGQPAGPQPCSLGAPDLQVAGLVPVVVAVATEERRAQRWQDGGRAPAGATLIGTGLGGGDLVEEAGPPRVEVAVPPAGDRAGSTPGSWEPARQGAARSGCTLSWGHSSWRSEKFQETPSFLINPTWAKLCLQGQRHPQDRGEGFC
jgi:hypothetical protein